MADDDDLVGTAMRIMDEVKEGAGPKLAVPIPRGPAEYERSLMRLLNEKPAGHAEAEPRPLDTPAVPGAGKAGRSIG